MNKKYLVVIRYSEEETYLFNSLKELYEFFEVKSIKELINENSWINSYTVYEINKIWK